LLGLRLPAAPPWGALAFLSAGALVANLYPIRSARNDVVYSVSDVFYFAGVILLPPLLIGAMTVLSWLPLTRERRRKGSAFMRAVVNAGQGQLAAVLIWLFLYVTGAGRLDAWTALPWLVGAVVLYTALRVGLVTEFVALNRGIRFRAVEETNLTSFVIDSLLPFFGLVIAVMWKGQPWTVLLMLPPAAAVYYFMGQIQLVRAVDVDAKSGLYNYPAFVRHLEAELDRVQMVRRPVSVLFADLDHLRDINNTYGHLAGDKVIEQVAKVLKQQLPPNATVARFGGEEFLAMLPGVDAEEAAFAAERVRSTLAASPVAAGDDLAIPVTISIGQAGFPADGTAAEALIHQADLAVYAAKALGRNRIVRACDLTESQRAELPGRRPGGAACPPAAPPPSDTGAAAAAAAPKAATGDDQALPAASPGKNPLLPLALLVAPPAAFGVLYVLPQVLDLPSRPLGLITVTAMIAGAIVTDVSETLDEKASLAPSIAVTMAAATAYGAAGAVLAGFIGTAVQLMRYGRRSWPFVVFNLSGAVLSALVCGLVMQLVGPPPGGPLGLSSLLAPLGAMIAEALVFNGLMATCQSLVTGRSLWSFWRQSFSNLMFYYVALGAIGSYTMSAFWAHGLPGAAMFLLPLGALVWLFSHRLRRTRHVISGLEQVRDHLAAEERAQKQALDQLVATLARITDARDSSVTGHSHRVARYAYALAGELGLSVAEAEQIKLAGLLHDLGKFGVPEAILNKPARLSPDEWTVVREHAALGQQFLSEVTQLREVARMVGDHHERWDGRGYPQGKQGEAISLGGRILAVADALDSILSNRVYRAAQSLEWALSEADRCAGGHFDPAVVKALQRLAAREGAAFFPSDASQSAVSSEIS
jgi:diguanylate cyclase (GGDEF)-like protein/putative nucleotidyltransferase with HDIG domain